jgi:hypothetical protein
MTRSPARSGSAPSGSGRSSRKFSASDQNTVVAKYSYGPEERQRLLDKINRIADNLQPADGEAAEPTGEDDENNSDEIPV